MTERYEAPGLGVSRILARLDKRQSVVKDIANRLDQQSVVAVVEYLEHRIEAMRGDENVKYELEQIRRDLGALVTTTILD